MTVTSRDLVRAYACACTRKHRRHCWMYGWLDRWQNRHNVRMATLSGEAADVSESVVVDWGKRSLVNQPVFLRMHGQMYTVY